MADLYTIYIRNEDTKKRIDAHISAQLPLTRARVQELLGQGYIKNIQFSGGEERRGGEQVVGTQGSDAQRANEPVVGEPVAEAQRANGPVVGTKGSGEQPLLNPDIAHEGGDEDHVIFETNEEGEPDVIHRFNAVNGEIVTKASAKTTAGEVYMVYVPPLETLNLTPTPMELDILFEDEHLIVLNKPAGLTVHPAPGNWENTLVHGLLAHCKNLAGIGGVERPGIVHRLDKDTSGVMVVAKTDAAHTGLAALFARRDIKRSYVALVYGVPYPLEGKIEADIGRHPKNRLKMAVLPEGTGGRHAITHYKVTQAFTPKFSVVELKLETGRTHQIRVHMEHMRHGVVADPMYGKHIPLGEDYRDIAIIISKAKRQMLHAQSLGFTHPITGEPIMCTSPMPKDMAALIKAIQHTFTA